jgi:hypothetical protein
MCPALVRANRQSHASRYRLNAQAAAIGIGNFRSGYYRRRRHRFARGWFAL